VLSVSRQVWLQMIGHAYDGLPDEACGLLAGPPVGRAPAGGGATGDGGSGGGAAPAEAGLGLARVFYPCRNAAESSRVYTVDPHDHLRADRDAEARGMELIGVMHSHTHTEAYPSPTDVDQAPDPAWHYVIVSLKREEPVLRSYRIVDGEITEEPVGLADQ
jgi:[CysO sulfur-carrier protein]-S-L-cysteine hydrolase